MTSGKILQKGYKISMVQKGIILIHIFLVKSVLGIQYNHLRNLAKSPVSKLFVTIDQTLRDPYFCWYFGVSTKDVWTPLQLVNLF